MRNTTTAKKKPFEQAGVAQALTNWLASLVVSLSTSSLASSLVAVSSFIINPEYHFNIWLHRFWAPLSAQMLHGPVSTLRLVGEVTCFL